MDSGSTLWNVSGDINARTPAVTDYSVPDAAPLVMENKLKVRTYFPNFSPSSMDWGSSLCNVSGGSNARTPAATDAAPLVRENKLKVKLTFQSFLHL